MNKRGGYSRYIAAAALAAGLLQLGARAPLAADKPAGKGPVAVVTIEGIIDPVLVRYVARAYQKAEKLGAQCVLIEINTPGGLEPSMREINAVILNSPLPTIAYVSPKGSRAASAGAFIVLACNFAAMAPGTTMGAAHPVAGQGKDIGGNLDKKITNDTAAYIKSLAARNGRDMKWAEDAVRKSVSVNENEALKLKLIDCIAENRTELLAKLDGRRAKAGDKSVTLALKGAEVVDVVITARERLFHAIANPEIAYILLMLGTVGLIFEFQTAGLGISGLMGIISLILGMISLSILPFNLGGLIFIILGIGLMIAELKFATHGILTVSGIACLLLGSLMLFSPLEPFWRVSRLLIFTTVGVMSGFFVLIAWLGLRAQLAPKQSGTEILPGAVGEARTALAPHGIVNVMGEDWSAEAAPGMKGIRKGARVSVKSVEGLKLVVVPADEADNKERRKA